MQKYEYKILAADARGGWLSSGGSLNYEVVGNMLNEFGREGWEVVTATNVNRYEGATKDVMIILKRPLSNN